jgi:predicted anti-sigma-YlaC factor YlaD
MCAQYRLFTAICLLAFCGGCSLKKMAVNKLGDAMASGGSTFESDEDPDLVAAAIPFGLKMYESLLAESPKHTGLLLAAATGFTEYAYAFVDLKAEETQEESVDRADALRERARKLYLRANRYAMRGLETRYAGFGAALDNDAATALKRVRKQDVPLLYWTAASLGLAISCSKGSPEMIAQLPLVEMIVNRIAELDESFENGAVPEFLITLEAARSGVKLEDQEKAMRQHFDRAIEISKGKRAGTYVSFAENASVPAQNAAEFKSLLEKALAIDVDADPDNRLANIVAQRRARWLLAHMNELFLESAPKGPA